ncbi:hypothetical protein [Streptomyces sp. NPDC059909]|uniref:hypothetical protein n=1 Tax=Streptomyces sp. NPDC059909 TaxID=3346998 RepID=UPI0036563330
MRGGGEGPGPCTAFTADLRRLLIGLFTEAGTAGGTEPPKRAWASLTEVAPVREGNVVFVSGAAGAVGSVAGQLARKLRADPALRALAEALMATGHPSPRSRCGGRG